MNEKGFLPKAFFPQTLFCGNKKGFLFSIDALLAISAIIAVSIAFFFLAQKTDSELLQVQTLRIAAGDKAIVDFYLGSNSATSVLPDEFVSSSTAAYCVKNYAYPNPISGSDPNPSELNEKNYCEGIQ